MQVAVYCSVPFTTLKSFVLQLRNAIDTQLELLFSRSKFCFKPCLELQEKLFKLNYIVRLPLDRIVSYRALQCKVT